MDDYKNQQITNNLIFLITNLILLVLVFIIAKIEIISGQTAFAAFAGSMNFWLGHSVAEFRYRK